MCVYRCISVVHFSAGWIFEQARLVLVYILVYLDELIGVLFLQTKTEDGYLLGLQRVSSSIGKLGGRKGQPVLLIHGLFMVMFP